MPVVPLLMVFLAQGGTADQPSAPSHATRGYLPSGSPEVLYNLGLLGRLRDTGVQPLGFSSYDRTGGNNDGFSGTYSKLRVENGNSVLAETSGPGIVQRIWFTHTSGEKPGLLNGRQEHLKLYLDGSNRPSLDVPLELILSGSHPHFPRPLVFEGSGGYVSYVPIPFQNGCKIVVEGQGVRFYQINILRLPPGTVVRSFTEEPGPQVGRALAHAVEVWSHPALYETKELQGAYMAPYEVEGLSHSTHEYGLRAGPATIRSIEVVPARGTEDAWKAARLRLAWDTDNTEEPGVDLPLGHAFGWVEGSSPYQSLLLGQNEGTWYDRFPMPYRRQAIVRIDTEKPLKGTIRVWTTDGIYPDAGFLHGALRQATPTRSKEDFGWLREEGHGHYAGVLLMTEGKAKLPYWLEGDDRFEIDGRLAVHGTGTEDYFNCGWYALPGRLDRPACYPTHGFPVYRNRGETWQAAAYRWHVADPVPFARSIDAGIEHGGENNVNANYRAAVFWYSDRPGLAPAAR
jgi:D-arabinan exo alpha-(1,3)/(1,5)-arabinofuranosidase (non-reducing end)